MPALFFLGDTMKLAVGTRVFGILTGFLAVTALASEASAQALQSTDKIFAGLSFGGQTRARTYKTSGSLPLYEETATFESTVGIGAETIIDISGGLRVWNNVGAGIGFSRYTDTSNGTFSASIPDPVVFDRPTTRFAEAPGLKHTESQIHLSAYWLQPVTDKIDVSVYAGPTIFRVKQDLASGFTVTNGTNVLATVTQTQVNKSAVGLHGGVDVRYLILKNAGVGLFLRYAGAKVDSDLVQGGTLHVGGFQYGVGVRVRY